MPGPFWRGSARRYMNRSEVSIQSSVQSRISWFSPAPEVDTIHARSRLGRPPEASANVDQSWLEKSQFSWIRRLYGDASIRARLDPNNRDQSAGNPGNHVRGSPALAMPSIPRGRCHNRTRHAGDTHHGTEGRAPPFDDPIRNGGGWTRGLPHDARGGT